tara:strand:+ start:126484 stop:128424 length:1941 start_codon:yes stop_codon:yes gene_type:complete
MENHIVSSLIIDSSISFDPSQQQKRLIQSLYRSQNEYGLDCDSRATENILTASKISELKQKEALFLRHATLGADWLHKHIGGLGFCTLVTDRTGATLETRANKQFEDEFKLRGLRLGACWSEAEQGTCGIGTAIVDKKPISVYQNEHFLISNQGISCGSIPIFGTNDEILGVLNATTMSAGTERQSLALAYNLASQAATRVEHDYFSEVHAADWIICLSNPSDGWVVGGSGALIAFDDSGLILDVGKQLKHQFPVDFSNQKIQIQDILNVSVEKLIDFAFSHPGSPMTIANSSAINNVHVDIRAPQRKPQPLKKTEASRSGFEDLTTSDPTVINCIDRLKRLSNHPIPILLLGETGTGKECFAKAIHEYSDRKNKSFVAINCAGIPESLIESELFGYKEGAFTGAKSKGSPGKILQAQGGTLFLDEIGDMPISLQTRLLRVLAEGEVLALGATEPEFVDIAVVCATHRDLSEMVKEGTFREDLYYRINSATFTLPSLRQRTDIVYVVKKIFNEEIEKEGHFLTLSDEVLNLLCQHTWPGNIRELRNVLRFCIAICFKSTVRLEHLPDSFFESASMEKILSKARGENRTINKEESFERNELIRAYRQSNWCASTACKLIGMSRATFYRKIKYHNILSPNTTDTVLYN